MRQDVSLKVDDLRDVKATIEKPYLCVYGYKPERRAASQLITENWVEVMMLGIGIPILGNLLFSLVF